LIDWEGGFPFSKISLGWFIYDITCIKSMKLKSQILVFLGILIIATISSGIFLSFFMTEKFHSEALQRSIDENANFVQTKANLSLQKNDFTPENYEQKEATLSNFFKDVDTSEILRIKVWSLDGTIVYSDNKEIMGQNFADNQNFKNSLTGKTIAEIKKPEKPENIAEKGYSQLMEIYVPITHDNKVSGVIEIYVSLDLVNESVKNSNEIIFVVVMTSSFTIIAVLITIYFLFSKNIIGPITRLQEATKQIAKGELDIHVTPEGNDEIQDLAHDINEMSKEIIIQRDKLIKNEKMKAIGELSSKIAHDMKNPLASMNHSLEIIQRRVKDDEIALKESQRANRVIKRIEHQINQVLNYVKTQPLLKEDTTILTILKQSLDFLSIPDNISLEIPEKDLEVRWDDTQISIVFTNIILNAIQAIGENKGKISIRVSEKDDMIKIEIENSGPNIPKKDLDKIFDLLYTTKMEGTGLGLSGCKNIIQLHKGTITVRNNPVKFTIEIPKSL